jgi:hypothetical protein
MADLQEMRARMRETRAAPVMSQRQGFKIPFSVVAVAAVAAGFVVVMMTPKFYSVQRTAALPAFKEVKGRSEEPAPASAAAQAAVVAAAPIKADYVGKAPEDVAGIADLVCAQRVAVAMAQPQQAARSAPDDGAGESRIAAENQKLSCFLSEGTARFCVPAQRRKATADVINYFKGIEYANASVGVMQNAIGRPILNGVPGAAAGNTLLGPDPSVVEAIEGLLRAGYIAQGNRDDILANVPHYYRDRFGRIVGNRVQCPERPWWQVWR